MNFNDMQPTVKTMGAFGSDSFNETLKDSMGYFAESNVQMISGFQEILGEQALFTEYVSRLSEGLNADEAEALEQLLENSRAELLRESTVSQVTPIVGLSMPIVRKMWVKTAMKNAIPTEVAKKPAFTIAWIEPYLRDANGKKTALPQAGEDSKSFLNLKEVPMPATGLAVNTTHNLIALAQAKHGVEKRDALDPIAYLTDLVDVSGDSLLKDGGCRVKLDIHSGFYGRLALADGKVCQVFGNLDCETGEFTVTVVGDGGTVKGVKVEAHLTAENNARTDSVSFDVRTKDIKIGVKAHINTEFPIEWVQDTMALYNIDATVECVDLMSNVVAQRLDYEILDFLEKSDLNQGAPFKGVFDVKPTAGFAGTPTEWRHELRTTIEWWANRIKSYNVSNFISGHFVIIGHPIDIQLIPDIQWQFQNAVAERAGVHVNYDFGIMTASNVFQVIASENVSTGKLRVIFVPNTDKFMTYKYYPYAFNIEKGYISPNMPYVPSIMMTKRHTIEELIPMQFVIEILHNDGSLIPSYRL